MSGKAHPSTGSEGTTGTNSSAGAPSTDSTGETEGAANRHGNALVEGVTTAFSWLSVIPVRGAQVFDRRTGRRTIAAAPAVAVVPGLAAVALVAALLAAPIVLAAEPGTAALRGVLAGVAIAAAAQLLTRAMHADGLADVADALGSYKDPAGAREILRDPRMGPMAAVTLILVQLTAAASFGVLALATTAKWLPGWSPTTSHPMLADAVSIASVPDLLSGAALLTLPFLVGRIAAVMACHHAFPPLTRTGFGFLVAATQPRWAIASWMGLGALVAYWAAGGLGVVALGLTLVACWIFVRHCVRRLGGVNGDVLGAIIELGTVFCAFSLALTSPFIQ